MLHRFLEQEEAIRTLFSMDRKTTHLLPTWQDIDVIKSIDEALSPLSFLTDLLSGEEYVTVVPMLSILEKKILKINATDTCLTKDIKKGIYSDIKQRYESYNTSVVNLLNLASILDPRFKMDYIDSLMVDDLKELLLSEGEAIGRTTDTNSVVSTSSAQLTQVTEVTEPLYKKRKLGSLFREDNRDENHPILSPLQAELEKYLSTPTGRVSLV